MGPGFQGMPENRFHVFSNMFLLTIIPERKSEITGVPFGRTDLSIGGIGTTFHAISHRHGPVGPNFQGMPETFDFHDFSKMLFLRFSRNVERA